MGAELAGAILGFAVVGIWIDRHYGTHPWGLLISAVVGLVGGLYNFFRSSLKSLDASNRRGGSSEDGGEGEGPG
jgi:F0F1-type ATP synthase assembly protein I